MNTSSPVADVPRSVSLLSRRSIVGAIVVSVVALVYVVAIPAIDRATNPNPFAVGEPYTYNNIQITPAPGWVIDSESELFLTLSESGVSLLITAAVDADQSPEEALVTARAGIESDTTQAWVIGDITTFVTDNGDHGAYVAAYSASSAVENWIINDGAMSVTLVGQAPADLWLAASPDLEAMVKSVVIVEDGE